MLIFLGGKSLFLVKNADFSREKVCFWSKMLIFLGKKTVFGQKWKAVGGGAHLQTKTGGNGRGPKRSNLMLNSLLKIRNFRLSWTPRQRHILNNSQKKVKQGVLAIFKTADVETGKFLVRNTSLHIFYPLGKTICKRLFIHIREFLAEPNTLCMFIFSVAVYVSSTQPEGHIMNTLAKGPIYTNLSTIYLAMCLLSWNFYASSTSHVCNIHFSQPSLPLVELYSCLSRCHACLTTKCNAAPSLMQGKIGWWHIMVHMCTPIFMIWGFHGCVLSMAMSLMAHM